MKTAFLKISFCLSFIILLSTVFPVFSQRLGSVTGDETNLYAQTKQVNQFFRRFNNEEDRYGNRYYPDDSLYRDNAFRSVYLNMLFDEQSSQIDKKLKKEFIEKVSDIKKPVFLDFHSNLWFAELSAVFNYHGFDKNLLLFLKLEQENLGYKWVLTNVYFSEFLKIFFKGDKERVGKSFLHPMSHELDFMNIHKVFDHPKYIEYYAHKGYHPDYLTLLFYEVKQGDMKFVNSGSLKFHFFQIDGWYFEVSFVNRAGKNSGWLITKLYKISDTEKEELIKFYLP